MARKRKCERDGEREVIKERVKGKERMWRREEKEGESGERRKEKRRKGKGRK